MNVRTRAIAGVILMSLLLVMYFVFVGVRAVALLGSGSLLAITMGVALLFLPLLGIWALLRELQFGRRATALVDQLRDEGQLPDFAAEQTQQTQQTEQTGSLPGLATAEILTKTKFESAQRISMTGHSPSAHSQSFEPRLRLIQSRGGPGRDLALPMTLPEIDAAHDPPFEQLLPKIAQKQVICSEVPTLAAPRTMEIE